MLKRSAAKAEACNSDAQFPRNLCWAREIISQPYVLETGGSLPPPTPSTLGSASAADLLMLGTFSNTFSHKCSHCFPIFLLSFVIQVGDVFDPC